MQNEHAAISRRLYDPDFQVSLVTKCIALAMGSSLLTTVLIVHDVYVWSHPPTPKYFVVDGKHMRPATALDSPITDDTQLLEWSARAVLAPYNVNYVDFAQQLSAASRNFTVTAWNSFAASLLDTKNFDAMKRARLVCYAQAQRAAVISEVTTVNGALAYRVQVPIIQTCENSNQSTNQNLIIKALVVRTNADDRPDGLAIDGFVAVRQ